MAAVSRKKRVCNHESTHHNGEDTLLHLTSIFRAEDDHFHSFEVDLDRRCRTHTLCKTIGRKLTSIIDYEIGFAEFCELRFCRTDEHVILLGIDYQTQYQRCHCIAYHEQGMVCPGTDDADFDSVLWIPL
jgi:hypothetical protein